MANAATYRRSNVRKLSGVETAGGAAGIGCHVEGKATASENIGAGDALWRDVSGGMAAVAYLLQW